MIEIASLERRIRGVELALILLSIAAIGAADRFWRPRRRSASSTWCL
jgi:hypothetical protein